MSGGSRPFASRPGETMPTGTDPQSRTGKAIVLLSDGTGNSAAKLFRTNVWRIYEGLDLTCNQVAFYDNGVGTSSFRLFAVLGGALGWGLKRNILDLYRFLCANYEPGDRIYAFGFSRGAFTIRILVGLIADQGVIAERRGEELKRLAIWAYRRYRRNRYNTTGGLVTPLRWLRDTALSWRDRLMRRQRYESVPKHHVELEFVGVWDTVDAYGLPIQELTRGWDMWVWPLSMRDRRLSPIVKKACHALALDDERHTFHPVLWDETHQPCMSHLDGERISQVWFTGVHSNVGGGYPDDGLAHVSLDWMAREAQKCHLRFQPSTQETWRLKADSCGVLYDSRSGFGGYYRYNPRSLARLTMDLRAGVCIDRPKIHESVFQRLRTGHDRYAPFVLPERYGVVTSGGQILEGDQNPYEHPTQSTSRSHEQERTWNLVWWRRIIYFATVAASALIVIAPFVFTRRDGGIDGEGALVSRLVSIAGSMLPGLTAPWVDHFTRHPFQLVIGGLTVAGLMKAGETVQQRIADRMRVTWEPPLATGPQAVAPRPEPSDWIFRLRTHPWYRGFFRALTLWILPSAFGISVVLLIALLAIGTVNRLVLETWMALGGICPDRVGRPEVVGPDQWRVRFPNSAFCYDTGVQLEKGARYEIRLKLPDGDGRWMDRTIPVTTPVGFSSRVKPLVFYPFLPFRRVLAFHWFTPIARVGAKGVEYHALDETRKEFTAGQSGPLSLFVNDAAFPWPFRTWAYENNVGADACVLVTKLPPSASATATAGAEPDCAPDRIAVR